MELVRGERARAVVTMRATSDNTQRRQAAQNKCAASSPTITNGTGAERRLLRWRSVAGRSSQLFQQGIGLVA
jgi:hypothetical protein